MRTPVNGWLLCIVLVAASATRGVHCDAPADEGAGDARPASFAAAARKPAPAQPVTPTLPPTPMATPAPPAGERVLFFDDFTELDTRRWQHEITASGGGNWEFQVYVNNRTNSYVTSEGGRGVLHIRPTLTQDWLGDISTTVLDLGSDCTDSNFYGCLRDPKHGNVVNPVTSARLRTKDSFAFKYGRVEVRARMPRGEWLWPAIWMMPRDSAYGKWPASGEIDIVESRGNPPPYPAGCDTIGSTLHWGPFWPENGYPKTHVTRAAPGGRTWADDFHTFGLVWTERGLRTYVDADDEAHRLLDVPFDVPFWERGGWNLTDLANPWAGRGPGAPFDREFYLILNLAVGGTNGYFPDGVGAKPWGNASPAAVNEFWAARGAWADGWRSNPASGGTEREMQVDWVRVTQLPA
eukprot:tig00000615_g2553.t1